MHAPRSLAVLVGFTALSSVMISSAARAQSVPVPLQPAPQQAVPLVPIPYISYIAANPLGIPFDIASVEGETGIAQATTVGLAAAYTELNNQVFVTGDLKFRYYPSGVVLSGLSAGASLGYTRFRRVDLHTSLNAPTIGVLLDYNWLLGTERRFLVGTGVAAKRILASASDREPVQLDRAYVSGRFVLGILF